MVIRLVGGGMHKRRMGLRGTNWLLQNSHGNVEYSIGNIISSIAITMYGVRWVLDLLVWSLCKLYKCLISVLYTWNVYVNYNWKKIKIKTHTKHYVHIKTCVLIILSYFIHNLQTVKQLKCSSIEKWINCEIVIEWRTSSLENEPLRHTI